MRKRESLGANAGPRPERNCCNHLHPAGLPLDDVATISRRDLKRAKLIARRCSIKEPIGLGIMPLLQETQNIPPIETYLPQEGQKHSNAVGLISWISRTRIYGTKSRHYKPPL